MVAARRTERVDVLRWLRNRRLLGGLGHRSRRSGDVGRRQRWRAAPLLLLCVVEGGIRLWIIRGQQHERLRLVHTDESTSSSSCSARGRGGGATAVVCDGRSRRRHRCPPGPTARVNRRLSESMRRLQVRCLVLGGEVANSALTRGELRQGCGGQGHHPGLLRLFDSSFFRGGSGGYSRGASTGLCRRQTVVTRPVHVARGGRRLLMRSRWGVG